MDLARSAARPSSKHVSTSASTARRSHALVVQRAAQQTGRLPCWSPRLEGARGSGTFKECQSLVEGIFGLPGSEPLSAPVVRDKRSIFQGHFTMQNVLFLMRSLGVVSAQWLLALPPEALTPAIVLDHWN